MFPYMVNSMGWSQNWTIHKFCHRGTYKRFKHAHLLCSVSKDLFLLIFFVDDFFLHTDISFIRVLNQTTPLNRPHRRDLIIHRLALQENIHGQRVLFRVIGSVPTYNLTCHR